MIIRIYNLIILVLLLSTATLPAQTNSHAVSPPVAKDFTGTLSFLSSDWMEGREAGARGGFMAADYIASMMQSFGLAPTGDPDTGHSKKQGGQGALKQTWFQNFEVIRCKPEKATFAFIQRTTTYESALQLSPGIDFELKSGPYGRDEEAPVVFAGYGIAAPGKGYDDYRDLNVNGRIVVVLDGFPGHADSTSTAWKKLNKTFEDEYSSVEKKLRTAEKHGAVALIIVSPDGNLKPFCHSQINIDIVRSAMNSPKISDPEYDDPEYFLPGDTTVATIPCFSLGPSATTLLLSGTSIVLTDFEKKIAKDLSPSSKPLPDKIIRFSVELKPEAIAVRNVLGMIRGKDSTKSIVVGAHYDHLGIRNGQIYNGADDNASGTSGMLALAKAWSGRSEQPACNIIFAAWTAEEKGLLGSSYFVRHTKANPDQVLLYLNMDMISRSAPEDTASKILSIGTMTGSDHLKRMAGESNSRLSHPFTLDLWDVTGHSGSDYGSFTAVKVPVMTFFSGFHDDYHSPRDISVRTDPEKMGEILKIVNDCILEFAHPLNGVE